MALEMFETGKGALACSADMGTGFICLGWREVVGRSSGSLGIHCDCCSFQSQPSIVGSKLLMEEWERPRQVGRLLIVIDRA